MRRVSAAGSKAAKRRADAQSTTIFERSSSWRTSKSSSEMRPSARSSWSAANCSSRRVWSTTSPFLRGPGPSWPGRAAASQMSIVRVPCFTPFRSREQPGTTGRAPAQPQKSIARDATGPLDPMAEGVGSDSRSPRGALAFDQCDRPSSPALNCPFSSRRPQRRGNSRRFRTPCDSVGAIRESTGQRSGWDLNPRWLAPHNISSVAPSASRTPLRRRGYQRPPEFPGRWCAPGVVGERGARRRRGQGCCERRSMKNEVRRAADSWERTPGVTSTS
jgi:hypothetical protein